jgi:serine phosphatase RsbU (regulator of sigma subunit)
MKKAMRLQTKITLIIIIVVFTSLSIISFFSISWMTDKIKNEVKANISNIAEMTAHSLYVQSALENGDPDALIRSHIDVMLKSVHDAEFIVVADMNGIRFSHPNPDKIGKRFVGGDETRVLQKGETYFSEAEGTLGKSLRIFTPIYNTENTQQTGFVSVGTLTRNIDATKNTAIQLLLLAAFISLIIGAVGAILLAKNIKKTLLGLEPAEISKLYSEITLAELALAEKMQKRIVAEEKFVRGKMIEVCCFSKMAKGVGGDYYTVRKYNDTRWVIAVCDVSGKGVTSSLIVSILEGMFGVYDFNKGLRSFLLYLNTFILNTFQNEKYITGIFLDYDENNNKIILSDSGHSLFYLIRSGEVYNCKTNKNNFPIGIEESLNPSFNKLDFIAGDILFIFTDGLVDQTDKSGIEYSEERLKGVLRQHGLDNIQAIRQNLIEDFNNFKGIQKQNDDITFLLIKFES